jgi:hypothetical protein
MTKARSSADFAAGGPQVAGKNAVINGGMDIWQRGTSFAVAASTNVFASDRWCGRRGATGMTLSRQTTSDTTNLPFIQYGLRMQRDSGNTTTNPLTVAQSLETVNSIPLAGRTITVSFYARRGANFSGTSNTFNCDIYTGTGTDENVQLGYTGSAQTGQVVATLTTTWQRFSNSVTIPTTATEIGLYFNYTPSGTAGAADFVDITGVQLEVGSVATPFSRAGGTIQGELAACQRYFQNVYNAGAWGQALSASTAQFYKALPCEMRVTPTGTFPTTYTNAINELGVALRTPTAFAAGSITVSSICFAATGASGMTTSRMVEYNGTTIQYSAEL